MALRAIIFFGMFLLTGCGEEEMPCGCIEENEQGSNSYEKFLFELSTSEDMKREDSIIFLSNRK